MTRTHVLLAALALALPASAQAAALIYATGQARFEPGEGHSSGNFIYRIDPDTGVATPVTGVLDRPTPAALGGTPDRRLLGFQNGAVVQVSPQAESWTPITPDTGFSATGFDVLADGRAYIAPFNAEFETQQLGRVDVTTGAVALLGSASAVGDAIDLALGRELGTAEPFIISLGSVGGLLYGVDLDSYSLVALDPDGGAAAVVGDVGAVRAGELAPYTGFSALTGFDRDGDGAFDELLGTVNFLDGARLGGIARFSLADGSWELLGTNPGVIFFGLGSLQVPEPGWLLAPALGFLALARRKRAG